MSYPRANMADFTWKPHGLVGFSRPNAQLLPNVTGLGWSFARCYGRRRESGDFVTQICLLIGLQVTGDNGMTLFVGVWH